MSVDITEWSIKADSLLADVPGCEWALAMLRMREVARDYFARTKAWVETFEELKTQANIPDYDILDIPHADVVALQACRVVQTDCKLLDRAAFDRLLLDNQTATQPRAATWKEGRLWLNPTPSTTNLTIRVRLALKPSDSSTGLPLAVWYTHIDNILVGTKAALYSSPKKPWSDPNLSAAMAQTYRMEIQRQAEIARRAQSESATETVPSF